ncbi:CopG family transcriptional regulator [uncultured Bifidobacterium sp.]|uniref:ribbon-helix-helix domain-containing protein n=1 Tax=uncultured Bifidobacterium sp. TaxID=165187 RepID=UPI0027DB2A25|nr:CopG family transcriptional regulator [uncultured Bifidobacterium sp.]
MEFKAEGGVTVTDDMLDAWADAAESGDYPGLGGDGVVYSGRIPPTDAELEAETVRAVGLSDDLWDMVDARAKHSGVSVSEIVRQALVRELATA